MIAWFAHNKVAANILMAVIMVSGGLSLCSVKREVFPSDATYRITVSVVYPGAAPEEVEEGICKRIENEVFGLEGVKKITSSAAEGVGVVTVHTMRDFDIEEVLDEVKSRVDAIDNFPAQARRPLVQEVKVRRQAISIAVTGDGDVEERSLKALAEEIRDGLLDLPEITQVQLISARPYEISVEVSELALRRYGLTLQSVADAIRHSSLDLPGGSVKTGGGEVMIRTVGQRRSGAGFGELVLFTRPDGTVVRVSDVGTVIDGFEESDQASRFDGEPTVLVQVYRVGDQDVVTVVEAVKRFVEDKRREIPDGAHLTLWKDETKILASRIGLLTRNLLSGLVLVFLVLAIFLRLRLAFWVALGIPISFLGCVALMPTFDISINMISLFAFLMVLGVVVDDAIVVGESVHLQRKQETSGILAAIKGTKMVAVPVTFGVLTTIAAFTPMLNMEASSAKLWRDIGLIVIGCLVFSLIESKLILPAHLSSSKFDDEPSWLIPRLWSGFRGIFTGGLRKFIDRIYVPTLNLTLHYRYVSVCAAVTILLLSISLLITGHVKRGFFPPMEGDNVVANLVLQQGASIEDTSRKIRILDDAAEQLRKNLIEEFPGEECPILHILTSIGTQPFNVQKSHNSGNAGPAFTGSHLGEVNIQLRPAELRTIRASGVLDRWKKLINISGIEELTYSMDLFGTGRDISVQLAGDDIESLKLAADRLRQHLANLPGVSEIGDTYRGGQREVKLGIKPSAETLGLTLNDLATQVRQGFYGEEIQRIQRKGEDMRVMVRYPETERNSLSAVEDMRIRTPGGDEVPFHTVAKAIHGRGFATISRSERTRTIGVTAKVDSTINNADQIIAKLDAEFLPQLLVEYSGISRYTFEGDNRDQAETTQSLMSGYLLVLFLIYALLAVPLKSYLQPLMVMSAIPFGFVGATLGHWFLGLEMSIMSMFGFIALTGVVVNDNLVLIDRINSGRRRGLKMIDAVKSAGVIRFRPILLTSLTTCASLTPLLMEQSVQASFLIPTAASLAFGVLFATPIALLLVPCFYLIGEDLRWVVTGRAPAGDEPESSESTDSTGLVGTV